jgi:hypothetical protein
MCETVPDFTKELRKNRFAWVIHGNGIQILNRESLSSTIPDFTKELWKNRFAWVIHGNGIQISNRESPGWERSRCHRCGDDFWLNKKRPL